MEYESKVATEPPYGDPGPAPQGYIVLIEDDDNVARAWALLFRSEGYRVVVAESASEARAHIKGLPEPPGLIISDFHLPNGADGIAAVAAIRSDIECHVPAFIVTGDTSKILHEVHDLDNIVVMRKPVSPDRMLRLARKAILSGTVSD